MAQDKEFGVRYVTVKVRTERGCQGSFEEQITKALTEHKDIYPASRAGSTVFSEVEVINVQLAFQFKGHAEENKS